MIKTNESGQTTVYIMEPEEELFSLRILKRRRTCASRPSPSYWLDNIIPIKDQAQRIGLRGGYDPQLIQVLWEFMELKGVLRG
jgi:hypothetical protein